ncbi:MAG: CorA family divalent cation transporter, partial [Longicatena sp.]
LSGTMDAFASVISNNLNIVMKILTVITIVMAIPNIVFSFYGMNVSGLFIPQWWFPTLLAVIACLIAILIFRKKDMFH